MSGELRVHIGHHFFGAGNIGDDLMMAGYLCALRDAGVGFETTCCVLGDAASQRVRFPEVTWLAVTPETVSECIARCDVWLGLGDTPFQLVGGSWFVDFLEQQADACARHGKPMYFLGVGVQDLPALRHPAVARLVAQAEATWTRDVLTYAALRPLAPERVHAGGDLAGLYLAAASRPEPAAARSMGMTLNFEDGARYDDRSLERIADDAGAAATPCYWLVQEVRPLAGSERAAYDALPDALRAKFALACPDYAADSVAALLQSWPVVSHAVTSRYHAALVHAWRGARVTLIERGLKVRSLGVDLGLSIHPDLDRAYDALADAFPVLPERLADCRQAAERSVHALLEQWEHVARA
jgi:polysaccharide pyruvyl transferase WcaK-like protein